MFFSTFMHCWYSSGNQQDLACLGDLHPHGMVKVLESLLLPWQTPQNMSAVSAAERRMPVGTMVSEDAYSPLKCLHKSASCSLPTWKSDLENAENLYVVQKGFESGCSFKNPSSFSFLPYLATYPGTRDWVQGTQVQGTQVQGLF